MSVTLPAPDRSFGGTITELATDMGAPAGPYPHRFPFTGSIERIEITTQPALDPATAEEVREGERRAALASQ